MSIKNLFTDFINYFKKGLVDVNNELLIQDEPCRSLDQLSNIQAENEINNSINNNNHENGAVKLDDKTLNNLSKGDENTEESVIAIINHEDENNKDMKQCKINEKQT